MLHTKAQDHWPSGSDEDFIFKGCLACMWWSSWSCDQDLFEQIFIPQRTSI